MRAVWNDAVLAESDETVVVEGNHYFPPDSLRREHFVESDHTTGCPWKGTASYYTVRVGDAENENAAWVYREPSERAAAIRDHVAFWRGVTVEP